MALIQNAIQFLITVANFSISFENSMKYLEHITRNYFSGESLLFIYWSNVSLELRHQLVDYWVTSGDVAFETCNCDLVTDNIIWERSFVKNTVVLFGDMIPEVADIRRMKQCVSWNARNKILAVVNNSENVKRVFDKIWTLTKAINVTVMVVNSSSVNYYTFHPYENFKIVELGESNLFPPKPLCNLHGSVIKVAINASEPFVLIPETPKMYNEGSEIRILNYLAKKFNFRIEVVKPPNNENPWMVLSADSKRIIGNLGMLDRGEADLAAFGVQIRTDRYSLADYTGVHTIDKMVWTVPIRPFTFNWKSIIIIFTKELWELLFITLILVSATLYFITKYEAQSKISYTLFDAFFQSLAIYLETPIYFYCKSNLYRLFIFTFSYHTMIILALYQSCLITYLTTRGSKDQYATIEEVVDDGLVGYLFPSGRPTYNLTDHDLWNKILSPGRHIYSDNSPSMISSVAYNKSTYTLMMESVVHYRVHKYLLDEDHKPMLRVLPKLFLPYLATILTSKGHPLRDVVQDNVMRLQDSGILEHWMEDIILKNLKMFGGAKSSEKGPMPLSVQQLRGAFYILPVMFVVASVVFVGEMIYYRLASHKSTSVLSCCKS